MTTTYSPKGFGPTSYVGPHEGLRVTFAQDRGGWLPGGFVPDQVEQADFRDNVQHAVDELASGGYNVAPASDVNVAPGELAATVDFLVTGGTVSVGQLVTQLTSAMYGPLDFLQRTYIRSVQHIAPNEWGSPIAAPTPDTEGAGPLDWLKGLGAAALVGGALVLLVMYAPELKLAAHAVRRKAS